MQAAKVLDMLNKRNLGSWHAFTFTLDGKPRWCVMHCLPEHDEGGRACTADLGNAPIRDQACAIVSGQTQQVASPTDCQTHSAILHWRIHGAAGGIAVKKTSMTMTSSRSGRHVSFASSLLLQ